MAIAGQEVYEGLPGKRASSGKKKTELPARHERRKWTLLRDEVTNHATEHRLR